MKITSIIADKKTIRLMLDTPLSPDAEAQVPVFSPICQEDLTPLAILTPEAEGNILTVDRFACGRDGLCLSYALMIDEEIVDGVQYVTDIEESDRTFPYPVVDTKKGLQVVDYKDAKELGVRHSAINVNEGDFLMPVYATALLSYLYAQQLFSLPFLTCTLSPYFIFLE